jgi:ketopantoate reductase
MFKMLKNPILKVKLNKILKNISTCTKCLILQNGLNVDEILIFKNFQLSRALKILMYYQIMNVIIIIYEIWNMK